MEMTVRSVPIGGVHVAERIRHDNGDIDALAKDIAEHGLLNPITVMQQAGGGYMLVAGLRRLKAVEQLGNTDIPAKIISPMEADETLELEISENMQRKDFTVSERLAYIDCIKTVEVEKARARMLSGKAEADPMRGRAGGMEKGTVRDIVAHKLGFSSSRQMERAQELMAKRPDLLKLIDEGEQTIYGAYTQMKREATAKEDHGMEPKHEMGSKPNGALNVREPIETVQPHNTHAESRPVDRPQFKHSAEKREIEPQRDGILNGGKRVGVTRPQITHTEGQHTDKAPAQIEDSEAAHEEHVALEGNDSAEKGNGTEPVDVLDTMESLVNCGIIEEKIVDVPFYEEVYRPEREPAPGNPRTLKGADHRHLLENPIYSRLYQEYGKAVMEINKSRGDTQLCSEGYERQIRSYKENLQACQREILRLRGMLRDLRAQLSPVGG